MIIGDLLLVDSVAREDLTMASVDLVSHLSDLLALLSDSGTPPLLSLQAEFSFLLQELLTLGESRLTLLLLGCHSPSPWIWF
jgi:hypothetical protein